IQGENFIAVPRGPDLEPTPYAELLQLAIDEFTAAQPLAGDAELPSDAPLSLALEAALARAYRAMGDPTGAETHAAAALGMSATVVVNQEYSAGEIENPFSTETRQYQPLPRLDFLDPKYTTRDAPIAVSKAEEMHLIQAEIDMAAGDYDLAAAHVADAILLALTRPTASFNDNDARANGDLSQRPNTTDILVAAEEGAPLRA